MGLRRIGTAAEACERFGVPVDRVPEQYRDIPVYVNPRLRSTFGKACEKRQGETVLERWIEVHKCVFADPEEMRETLAHELAHVIVGVRENHSPLWRRVARNLGSTGDRAATTEHAARIGIRKDGRVVARCKDCGHEVRRRKALRPGRYLHRNCGGEFVLIEEVQHDARH